jgi:Arc/MetJ-type ribon-helix-helix transcriptional regulator
MKQSISVTIDKELVEWIDKQVDTKKYRNRSHLVELSLSNFREAQKKAP